MRRIEPVVRDGRDRIGHRRGTMGICDGSERRLTDRTAVELPAGLTLQRSIVSGCEFHEEIVGMLPVVNLFALADLTARQQIRIPATTDRPRFSADHRSKLDPTRTGTALRHAHDPVDAASLAGAAIAGLVKPLQEGILVKHDLP